MNATTFKILQFSTDNADEPSIQFAFKTGTKNFERRRLIARLGKRIQLIDYYRALGKKNYTINELRMKIKRESPQK